MTPRLLLLPAAALLLAAPAALAQTTPAPAYDLSATHRYVQPTQVWPQVLLDDMVAPGHHLQLALQGRRILSDAYAVGRSLGFDARQARLSYDYHPSDHWNVGGSVRVLGSGSGPVAVIPEVLLRHRKVIVGTTGWRGLILGQRLSVERTFSSGGTQALESGPADQTWGRLRVDAEYEIGLGPSDAALLPRLSYEAATHLRLQKADTDPDERTIQYTSLRAEVGVRIRPFLDVTPWFAYQTRYLETLPQYDANNNPTAGGKINAVYPTFGLDLRFVLNATHGIYRRLPSQW